MLNEVKLFVDCDAFNGGDLRAFRLQDRDEAGINQIPVH